METRRDQSEFNMALDGLKTVRYLLNECLQASQNLDAYTWYHSLRGIYREISQDMDLDEYNSKMKELTALNTKIMKSSRLYNQTGQMSIDSELYDRLEMLEVFIRKVLKETGKWDKTIEEGEKALR